MLQCILTKKKYFHRLESESARNNIHPNNKQKPEITNKNTGKITCQYGQPDWVWKVLRNLCRDFHLPANDSTTEQVCPPLVYTMCKAAWVKKKRCCQQSAFFATNTPSQGVQMHSTARPLGEWNIISRTCNIPNIGKHENKKLFELNVYFVGIFRRFYTYSKN